MKIGFIGGGNMAAALIGGIAGKLTEGKNIHVVDVVPTTLESLTQRFGVTASAQPDAVLAHCDVIVLAVKPQQMRDVAAAIRPFIAQQLVVSIAAGIRGSDLMRWLGDHPAVVRAMPNTPALIGKGMTGMVAMPGVRAEQRAAADAILRATGATIWLDNENLIDAVTAVSGSGPAYVFYFMEAMQQAATELGLSDAQGLELVKATFDGAVELARRSTEPMSLLRERVTSKGGTTYAALTTMHSEGVAPAIVKAVKAAAARGKELGDEFGRD